MTVRSDVMVLIQLKEAETNCCGKQRNWPQLTSPIAFFGIWIQFTLAGSGLMIFETKEELGPSALMNSTYTPPWCFQWHLNS